MIFSRFQPVSISHTIAADGIRIIRGTAYVALLTGILAFAIFDLARLRLNPFDRQVNDA